MPASPREARQMRVTERARNSFSSETKSTANNAVLNIEVTAAESKKILRAPTFFIRWPRNKVAKI